MVVECRRVGARKLHLGCAGEVTKYAGIAARGEPCEDITGGMTMIDVELRKSTKLLEPAPIPQERAAIPASRDIGDGLRRGQIDGDVLGPLDAGARKIFHSGRVTLGPLRPREVRLQQNQNNDSRGARKVHTKRAFDDRRVPIEREQPTIRRRLCQSF